MMTALSVEAWVALGAAVLVMQASPGPATMTLVGYTIEHGRGSAGSLMGAFVGGQVSSALMAMAGLGLLLMKAPVAVTTIQLIAGMLLLVIGVRHLLFASSKAENRISPCERSRGAVKTTWLITTCSPIALVFYVSVLPKFLDSAAPSIETLVVLACVVLTCSSLVF